MFEKQWLERGRSLAWYLSQRQISLIGMPLNHTGLIIFWSPLPCLLCLKMSDTTLSVLSQICATNPVQLCGINKLVLAKERRKKRGGGRHTCIYLLIIGCHRWGSTKCAWWWIIDTILGDNSLALIACHHHQVAATVFVSAWWDYTLVIGQ